VVLEKDDVTLVRTFCGDAKRFEAGWTNDMLIVLDVLVTDDMRARGMLRQVVNRVQKLRKAAGLNVNDEVGMAFATVDGKKGDGVVGLLRARGDEVQKVVGGAVVPWDGKGEVIAQAECEIGDEFILLVLLKKK
jgi:isoleucyl-tRNA synthetase